MSEIQENTVPTTENVPETDAVPNVVQNPVHTEEQPKVKKPRSAAQIAAFERARKARTENLRQLSE
ncbi:hypothetical protein HDU85_002388, partial [Gaertneriomyces sp. JEL0708]